MCQGTHGSGKNPANAGMTLFATNMYIAIKSSYPTSMPSSGAMNLRVVLIPSGLNSMNSFAASGNRKIEQLSIWSVFNTQFSLSGSPSKRNCQGGLAVKAAIWLCFWMLHIVASFQRWWFGFEQTRNERHGSFYSTSRTATASVVTVQSVGTGTAIPYFASYV